MKSPMPKAKTKAETANIHAVIGSDEAEVKRVAAELAQKLAPEQAGDFGLGAANVALFRQYQTCLAEKRELSRR